MAQQDSAQSELQLLTTRLGRYPVSRYPVQHATLRFHLGTALLHAGSVGGALEALAAAREVFGRVGMRLEGAKATNMLGVALREAGRQAEAHDAFGEAAAEFAALGQPVEQAAADYNLGLVRRDSGDLEGAYRSWQRAREAFTAAGRAAQAAAATREHGACLLRSGDLDRALPLLEEAAVLAEAAGDGPGLGATANALGLGRLAAGDVGAAVAAFRRALGAFPRNLRAADYAMGKANLALTYEQAGEPARARLAARQAQAVPVAAPAVVAQARQVLARLPDTSQDLMTVLDAEPAQGWAAVIREEVLRLQDEPATERLAGITGFVGGVLARPGAAYDLTAALLSVFLELPPASYEEMVTALVRATAGRPEPETERAHAVIRSAMARFPLPQWQRLAATCNAAAARVGQPATWS